MATSSKPRQTSTTRLVLVVDDDARVRESLADLLHSAGIQALCFGSGQALLSSKALDASTCLITDVRMPGMDGWQLQQLLAFTHPGILIIFLSAFQDPDAVECARRLGAFAFIYKPFDGEELLRIVESALLQLSDY